MNRDAFKQNLNDFVDELVDTDRELTEADQEKLTDQLGDVASDIFENEEGDDSELDTEDKEDAPSKR